MLIGNVNMNEDLMMLLDLFGHYLMYFLGLCSPINEVLAAAMDTGVAAALIHLRQAGGVVVALRTQAGEAVDAVHARAPVVTGVYGALVDVDVTHGTWESDGRRYKKTRI